MIPLLGKEGSGVVAWRRANYPPPPAPPPAEEGSHFHDKTASFFTSSMFRLLKRLPLLFHGLEHLLAELG